MSRMSANFLAAVRGVKDPPLVPVVTFYWPTANGGTKHYSSESFQYFEPRITAGGLGDIDSGVSERPSDLTFVSTTVALADHDGEITTILNGATDPRRSRVVIRWAHPSLAEADWFTLFDGIVNDWTWARSIVTVDCTTDDGALMGYCPKLALFTGAVPGLVNSARGLYAPIIYGIHDDQSLGGQGAVPCPNIQLDATNGYAYLVGIGTLKAVPRVYKNGSLQTLSTHYTLDYPLWGGVRLTTIRFVGATTGTDEVTADVEGLTDDASSSGNVILSAIAQLKHFIVNFVYGDYRSGSWAADATAPIDTMAFASAATFASRFGDEGSWYLGGSTEQTRAIDEVNKWLRSQAMLRGRWSNEGKLGLVVFDHASGDYVSAPWVQQERDELEPMTYRTSAAQLVSRVSVQYLPGRRAGKLWQSIDVQDLPLWETEKVTETVARENSPARFG